MKRKTAFYSIRNYFTYNIGYALRMLSAKLWNQGIELTNTATQSEEQLIETTYKKLETLQ